MPLASRLLRRRFLAGLEGIRGGRLDLSLPDGSRHRFGDGGAEADLRIGDWAVLPALAARGQAGFADSWAAGQWHSSSPEAVLILALRNRDHLAGWFGPGWLPGIGRWLTGRMIRRGAPRAPRDIGNEFYQLWLDPGMSYSAALFDGADNDLEQAQARKNGRLLSRLTPGESVLDIGCGWGGFAEAAAERGRRVTGLTRAPAQKGYADARLDGRAEIRLQDYRQTTGSFDNIVSVEMIETLAERDWPGYFAAIRARLAPGGRAILQAVTVPDAEFSISPPSPDAPGRTAGAGARLPCNAVMAREAARVGLVLSNSFGFGQDYARTCRLWAARMAAETPRLGRFGYDERFLRRWQFHLQASAASFATGRTDVVQIELTHPGSAA